MIVHAKRIILHSESGYSKKHDSLLKQLVNEKISLFCTIGKDCEFWHDIMDDFYIGYGEERDFLMITTWHTNETLNDVIEFAKDFDLDDIDNKEVQIIEV